MRLRLEDGQQLLLNVIKEAAIAKAASITDFFNKSSQKCQMKASVLELVRVLGKPDVEIQQILQEE